MVRIGFIMMTEQTDSREPVADQVAAESGAVGFSVTSDHYAR